MLSLAHGIDVPLRRPAVRFGDVTYPDAPSKTIRVARQLNPPQRVRTAGGQEASSQDGNLYVYRSEEVLDGDKVALPEGSFIVRGTAQNDMVHPMNGHNFGVKRYRIERG